jgi:hypothetical protein
MILIVLLGGYKVDTLKIDIFLENFNNFLTIRPNWTSKVSKFSLLNVEKGYIGSGTT